jgi:hypothetical protein
MRSTDLPRYYKLAWPVLKEIDDLGGSASIGEIVAAVSAREKFTDEQQTPCTGTARGARLPTVLGRRAGHFEQRVHHRQQPRDLEPEQNRPNVA